MRRFLIILAILLFSNICFAEYKFSFVKENIISEKEALKGILVTYVRGVSVGITWANELTNVKNGGV